MSQAFRESLSGVITGLLTEESSHIISVTFSGFVGQISGKFRDVFGSVLGNLPGNFLDISREISRKFPGHFRENSGKFPGFFGELSSVNRVSVAQKMAPYVS